MLYNTHRRTLLADWYASIPHATEVTRYYLAGPMTGYPEYNSDAFKAAASALREKGYGVVSPHELDAEEDLTFTSWGEFLARDLQEVLKADGVVVLPNWEASKGARLEVDTALRLGKPVLRFPSLEPLTKEETILEEAQRLVTGDRGADYGHPIDDFGRTAQMWSALLGIPVSAADVALCMAALKLSREVNRPKRDNRVDAAGYLLTLEMVRERE